MEHEDAAFLEFLRIAAWFVLGLFVLMLLCEGDPDIIDGLAKRANTVECASN